jgi:hypothetical protein
MLRYGVFSSRWPLGQQTVWTIVNRNEYDVDGPQIELATQAGMRYFDLYHGAELKPAKTESGRAVLSFAIEAHGFGALLAAPAAPDSSIEKLMSKMKALSAKPLVSYSHNWDVLPQQIVSIAAAKAPASAPPDMVRVPEADFEFNISGIEIEGFNDIGVDVQYP